MLVGTCFASIPDLFPDPVVRLRWQVLFSSAFGVANALGPSLGGFLSQHYGWRSAFLVNLPVGLASLLLVSRYLPRIVPPRGAPTRLARCAADRGFAGRLADAGRILIGARIAVVHRATRGSVGGRGRAAFARGGARRRSGLAVAVAAWARDRHLARSFRAAGRRHVRTAVLRAVAAARRPRDVGQRGGSLDHAIRHVHHRGHDRQYADRHPAQAAERNAICRLCAARRRMRGALRHRRSPRRRFHRIDARGRPRDRIHDAESHCVRAAGSGQDASGHCHGDDPVRAHGGRHAWHGDRGQPRARAKDGARRCSIRSRCSIRRRAQPSSRMHARPASRPGRSCLPHAMRSLHRSNMHSS